MDDVTQDSREDCYLATLHIDNADLQDQRPYYLVVENERGTDRHAINLRVEGMFSGRQLVVGLQGAFDGLMNCVPPWQSRQPVELASRWI